MPSGDGGKADVILSEMKPLVSIFRNRDIDSKMEKNCTGICNAVMTKSHDLAEFVRGAQVSLRALRLWRPIAQRCGRFQNSFIHSDDIYSNW